MASNRQQRKDPSHKGNGISEGGSSTADKAFARSHYGTGTADRNIAGGDGSKGRSAGSGAPGGSKGGDSSSCAVGRKESC